MTHRADSARINFKVRMAGLTLRRISLDSGLGIDIAAKAVYEPHKAGEEAIASALNVPAHKLWPRRYDENGNRLSPQPRKNYRKHVRSKQRQKAEAV